MHGQTCTFWDNLTPFSLEVIAAITGIRYAWGASACCPGQEQPNSCPIRGYNSTLPAAPFMAKVVNGKCSCTPPQKCDA